MTYCHKVMIWTIQIWYSQSSTRGTRLYYSLQRAISELIISFSNYHQLPAMIDVANSSGTDGTPSDLALNIANLNDNPPGPTFNPLFEQPTPFSGLEQQYVPHYDENMSTPSNYALCRYQPYFDIVQKHIMLIDQQEFLQSVVPMETHQCMALKYATALSGSTACGELSLAMKSYTSARFHLEQAENLADNSSFLNVETVQALLLVARFEFTHISGPKGLLTIARAMQLLSLLGYDMLDQASAEGERESSQMRLPKTHSPGCIQMIRRTFWIAFAMHCNAAASFSCCIPVKDNGVSLYLFRLAAFLCDQQLQPRSAPQFQFPTQQ